MGFLKNPLVIILKEQTTASMERFEVLNVGFVGAYGLYSRLPLCVQNRIATLRNRQSRMSHALP